MLTNANGSDARARRVWLAGAGVAFGAGVWATHFVAMLAFDSGLPMQFRLGPTVLSALLAMAGATTAFALRRLLPARMGEWSPLPATYAGGANSIADLEDVTKLGRGKIDLTIGSALDIFGGTGVRYADAVAFNRKQTA